MSDFVQGINTGVQAANGFLQGRRKATADQLRIDIEEKEQKRKEKAATERSKLNEQRFMLNELNLAEKRDEQQQEVIDQNFLKENASKFLSGTPEQQKGIFAAASSGSKEQLTNIYTQVAAINKEKRAVAKEAREVVQFQNTKNETLQKIRIGKRTIEEKDLALQGKREEAAAMKGKYAKIKERKIKREEQVIEKERGVIAKAELDLEIQQEKFDYPPLSKDEEAGVALLEGFMVEPANIEGFFGTKENPAAIEQQENIAQANIVLRRKNRELVKGKSGRLELRKIPLETGDPSTMSNEELLKEMGL